MYFEMLIKTKTKELNAGIINFYELFTCPVMKVIVMCSIFERKIFNKFVHFMVRTKHLHQFGEEVWEYVYVRTKIVIDCVVVLRNESSVRVFFYNFLLYWKVVPVDLEGRTNFIPCYLSFKREVKLRKKTLNTETHKDYICLVYILVASIQRKSGYYSINIRSHRNYYFSNYHIINSNIQIWMYSLHLIHA